MTAEQLPLFAKDGASVSPPPPDWGEQDLQPIPIDKDRALSPVDLVPPDALFRIMNNYNLNGNLIGRLLRELGSGDKSKSVIKINREALASLLAIPSERLVSIFTFSRKAEMVSAANQLMPFGNLLLQEDPYLLNEGIAWFLHFLISSNANLIVWSRLFNHIFYQESEAAPVDLISYFPDIRGNKTEKVFANNTRNEIAAVLRTYADDLFKSLGMIVRIHTGHYTVITDEFLIPLNIWLASILAYRDLYYPGAASLETRFLVDAHFSPGRLFRQKEEAVRRALDALHNQGLISVETRLGLDQVRFKNGITWLSAIARHFEEDK
ncbi:MAG: DUF4007 family protein [Leptolinea sp.]